MRVGCERDAKWRCTMHQQTNGPNDPTALVSSVILPLWIGERYYLFHMAPAWLRRQNLLLLFKFLPQSSMGPF